ncbi:glucose-6-phosphate dehydrogenase [Candidatus Leptofilum sp.]|uniref:glucose-6-phosphate dehydrogenase n=1 Tax=Candidatus Leptofilum sp. TaxID=3241576 RepID=UPI003B5A7AF0
MSNDQKPTTFVIFGASGDLTRRKLIPALFNSYCKERLPAHFNIVGFARRPWDDDQFRQILQEGMQKLAPETYIAEKWEPFSQKISYARGDLPTQADYLALKNHLEAIEQGAGNRLYYMATAPRFFVPIVENLGAADMVEQSAGWRRVVVEKPFGHDLASAKALNHQIQAVFEEEQIYRIDHYLGKETAQNILYFRFANTIFEPVWNRNYVDNVQIMVTESVDVGHRAGYYDQAGVVRDMFQNHLMQLLSLVAIEPPASFKAVAVRNEKAKLFHAIRPLPLHQTVRAQYDGYLQAEGVAQGSQVPTYAAMELYIDNWRWQGVPFYLRSGKALAAKNTEIVIEFKQPPHLMFDDIEDEDFTSNILSLCIQPDEGIHLKLEAKVPDSHKTQPVDMEFHYRSSFKGNRLPDAYERLLLDAVRGDASLFTRADGIEAAWALMDPVIHGWENDDDAPPMATYRPGSWGPAEADALLARSGRIWRHACSHPEP